MERNHLPYRPGMLQRGRITDALTAGLDYPLITLVAGPGYGKTQAVAQFARDIPHRLIWINLTQLDNNAHHFWHKSVAALQHESPQFAALLLESGFPSSRHELDRHLGMIAGDLGPGQETVLVLDNFSVLEDGSVRRFLETLINLQFANLCVILISADMGDRERAQALVGRDCLEITSATLRFTRDEAAQLFKIAEVAIDDAYLDDILRDTEGWPMAVYLMCRLLVGGKNPHPPGDARIQLPELDRLFESGFFLAYPSDIQRMLVCFSFLPAFSLEMAQAFQAGQPALADHVLGNVFIAYDYSGQVFTFHPMYQRFLQRNRHAVTDAELEAAHKVAGDWFFARGSYFEAIACFFQCPCYMEMAEAIRMLLLSHAQDIPAAYLLDYLKRLPADFLGEHPEIRFSIALLYVSQLRLREAKALLLAIEAELTAEGSPDGARAQLLGEVYAMLANVAVLRNDDACFAYYPKAAALLPDGSHYHSGDLMYAGNNNLLFLPGCRAGLLREMVDKTLAAAQYTDRYMNGQGYGGEYLFAAEASYAICDIETMHKHCHRAIFRAMKTAQHDIICNAYFLQMRGDVYTGNYAGVQQRLEAMREYSEKYNIDKLAEIYDNALGWLNLRLGTLERVPKWIAEYDENRYAKLPVTIGRNKIGHACYLAAKHRYSECIAYLDEMEGLYEESALWTIRLHHYIIKAICLEKTGADDEAVRVLHRAYRMTHENDANMCFAEYTDWLSPLLTLAEGQGALPFDERWLQTVKEKAARFGRGVAVIRREQGKEKTEPPFTVRLSRREREVLTYLVNGKTRGEIARELGISVNSVKTHLGGAYSKLGAANRGDAIRLAISMGIH